MAYELPETVRRSRASAAAKIAKDRYGLRATGELCYNEIGRNPTLTEAEIADVIAKQIEDANKRPQELRTRDPLDELDNLGESPDY